MKRTKKQRLDMIKRNTAFIKVSGFSLQFFSEIHVRIDDRVDLWLSTGTWHIKGEKSSGKSYNKMLEYLKR